MVGMVLSSQALCNPVPGFLSVVCWSMQVIGFYIVSLKVCDRLFEKKK